MIEWLILLAGIPGFLFFIYNAVVILTGVSKPIPPIPHAPAQKRIAAVIPARNEHCVIGHLIESLKNQNYPESLTDFYVVINNCSDDTAAIAAAAGAKIITCDVPIHSKGDALRFAFGRLLAQDTHYDGYAIFDADNIVDPGFFQAANNALVDGCSVAQGYRDSKNPRDNWVAGCTSVFFWFMNRFFNHARAAFGITASLNGTGILISDAYLRRYEYDVSTLTEDLEMNAQVVLNGESIRWMPDAITYDEQPTGLAASIAQRRRWAYGMRQCTKKYLGKLFYQGMKHLNCLDIAMVYFAIPSQIIGVFSFLFGLYAFGKRMIAQPALIVQTLGALLGATLLGFFLVGIVFTLMVCLSERKLRGGRSRIAFTMGFYLLTWTLANFAGCWFRAPGWKPIPHTSEATIPEPETTVAVRPTAIRKTESI